MNAHMRACLSAMTTKTTHEHRTARSCPCCKKAGMDIAPRTKSRRTKRTNLGCAAFQGLERRDKEHRASWQSRTTK